MSSCPCSSPRRWPASSGSRCAYRRFFLSTMPRRGGTVGDCVVVSHNLGGFIVTYLQGWGQPQQAHQRALLPPGPRRRRLQVRATNPPPSPPPKGHGNPPHTIRMIFHSKLAPHAFHMESINTGWASPSRTARWPSRSPWGESTGGPTAPSPTSHARSRGASWRWSRRTGWRGWCVCLVRLCGDGWEGKRKEGKVLGEIAAPIFLPHCGLVSTCGLDA